MSNISCTAGATGSCVCSDSNDYPVNWFSPQYINPPFPVLSNSYYDGGSSPTEYNTVSFTGCGTNGLYINTTTIPGEISCNVDPQIPPMSNQFSCTNGAYFTSMNNSNLYNITSYGCTGGSFALQSSTSNYVEAIDMQNYNTNVPLQISNSAYIYPGCPYGILGDNPGSGVYSCNTAPTTNQSLINMVMCSSKQNPCPNNNMTFFQNSGLNNPITNNWIEYCAYAQLPQINSDGECPSGYQVETIINGNVKYQAETINANVNYCNNGLPVYFSSYSTFG